MEPINLDERSIDQLKVLVYDTLRSIEISQQNMKVLNEKIVEKEQIALKQNALVANNQEVIAEEKTEV